VLDLEACQRATLVDEAIVFSILRGFFSAAAIQWDPTVKHWMESVSHKAQVPLLK
jgi:glutaredoxin 2